MSEGKYQRLDSLHSALSPAGSPAVPPPVHPLLHDPGSPASAAALSELTDFDELDASFADIDFADQPAQGTSTMRMAFMNMANSILGAGIIGQPLAMRNSGIVGGVLVMVLITGLIDWTLRLIVVNAQLSQTRLYQDTVYRCYGQAGRILLLATISSFAYGGCMAFCVIIGDTIPHVLTLALPRAVAGPDLPVHWLFGRNFIIVLFTSTISYPLSLNRDISKLAKALGFALVGMLIIVVLTLVRGPMAGADLKAPLTSQEKYFNSNIVQGISVISFALVCHHNTIYIYHSMKNASVGKFSKLTHWACGISMCFCLLMGVPGLLNFGHNTKGNILNNFRSDDPWINVARFCFGLNMLTTFPLEIFVVRDVLKDILLSLPQGTAHLELSTKQHVVVTTILVFSLMSVLLFTCNLGMILELIGATSASLMAYIIPPLCFLKLSWDAFDYKRSDTLEKRSFMLKKALPSIACALFGIAIMLIGSYMTIRDTINNPDGDTHCVSD